MTPISDSAMTEGLIKLEEQVINLKEYNKQCEESVPKTNSNSYNTSVFNSIKL